MLPIELTAEGWHKHALLMQAGEVERHPKAKTSDALKEMAVNVRLGLMPASTPLIVAVKESTGGGYPPVIVCVPFDQETVHDLMRGDPAAAQEVGEALEEAAEAWLVQVKAGRAN